MGEARGENSVHHHVLGQACPVQGCGFNGKNSDEELRLRRQYEEKVLKTLEKVSSTDCQIPPPLKETNFSKVIKIKPESAGGDQAEFMLTSIKQQRSNDCGPTVLEMLGYNRQDVETKILNGENRELTTHDIILGAGGTWIEKPEQESDYTTPHVQLLDMDGRSKHWVVRTKDETGDEWIFCPANGAARAEDYKEKTNSKVLFQFTVPIKLSTAQPELAMAA